MGRVIVLAAALLGLAPVPVHRTNSGPPPVPRRGAFSRWTTISGSLTHSPAALVVVEAMSLAHVRAEAPIDAELPPRSAVAGAQH